MVEWYPPSNGQELGQAQNDNEGQGSLGCCSPRGHKESEMTWQLNSKNFDVLRNQWQKMGWLDSVQFSPVQMFSHVQQFATTWTAALQASLSITNSRRFLKLIPWSLWCHPTISSSAVPFSSHLQFFSASGSFQISVRHIREPKYWSFKFSISPSNEYSGLISFRIDFFALLAVQRTLRSLLQHHSSKVSILWHSAFFIVQLSHPYTMTGETISLTRWTFVCKVMSLLFLTCCLDWS